MHLSSYQITRFHHAGLAPTELLAIDDHLLGCEFCRQQLRSNLNLSVTLRQFQKEFQELPEERHISPEDRTAYVQNRLSRVERELVTSHLKNCAHCKTQIEFLQNDATELPPTIGTVITDTLAFLGGRAALIWPIPVTAIFVIVAVAFADYWFFHQPEKTVAPQPIERSIQRNEPTPNGRVEFANSDSNSQPKQKQESRKSSQH